MKTNIKRVQCRWRGKELPETLEDVADYSDLTEFDVLFAGNLQTEDIRFKSLLNTLLDGPAPAKVNIYYPDIQSLEIHSVDTQHLLSYVVGEGFSTVIYVFDDLNDFLIYSNSRDSLSFWVVPRNKLTKQEVKAWDAQFERHLKSPGIGFGDEGKAYAKQLLGEASRLNARSRARFMPMLSLV